MQVGVISNTMKPAHDQIHVRVDMAPEDMDRSVSMGLKDHHSMIVSLLVNYVGRQD